jgi:hypothetical protein
VKRVVRAVQALAFAYHLISALVLLVGGIVVAIIGATRTEGSIIAIGVVVAAIGLGWLALDIWPGRRSLRDER